MKNQYPYPQMQYYPRNEKGSKAQGIKGGCMKRNDRSNAATNEDRKTKSSGKGDE